MRSSHCSRQLSICSLSPALILGIAVAVLSSSAAPSALADPIPKPPPPCTNDLQGVDDEPGQKDLTQLCETGAEPPPGFDIASVPAPFERHVSWNFDNTAWSGANTGDACALYDDDDADVFADFAVCVTIEDGPPATKKAGSPKIYQCGNDRVDRCTGAVLLKDSDGTTPAPVPISVCEVNEGGSHVSGQDADPFAGSHACAGADCETLDAITICFIDESDFGVAGVTPTDVCSYPSEQPNSDPSDCVRTPTGPDPCAGVDCTGSSTACTTASCDPNGADGNCDIQTPKAEGTACGSSSDTVCDNPDTCNASGVCVPNTEPMTTECRADAGDCDVPELCDGAGNCPADAFEAVSKACGDQTNNECNNPNHCSGTDNTCVNEVEPATTECRADAGDCDVPELCDGAGNCPADAFEAVSKACGDQTNNECNNPNHCSGTDNTCVNEVEPDGTACTDLDGFDCTDGECAGGACVSTPDDVNCDDSASCTDEVCDPDNPQADPVSGCVITPNDAKCDDNDICTDDACDPPGSDASGCVNTFDAGNALSCSDFNCRTAGFWGTHAGVDPKKKDSQNITQAVMNHDPYPVICGMSVQNTLVGEEMSAIETECVSPKGEQRLQLARQLLALSLNCVMTKGNSDCSGTIHAPIFSQCNADCIANSNPGAISVCQLAIDCINNGGDPYSEPGVCNIGTCSQDSELCSSSADCAPMTPAQTCNPFPNNCHGRPLELDPDGPGGNPPILDFEPPGPAGSSKGCNDAIGNDCTLFNCPPAP